MLLELRPQTSWWRFKSCNNKWQKDNREAQLRTQVDAGGNHWSRTVKEQYHKVASAFAGPSHILGHSASRGLRESTVASKRHLHNPNQCGKLENLSHTVEL